VVSPLLLLPATISTINTICAPTPQGQGAQEDLIANYTTPAGQSLFLCPVKRRVHNIYIPLVHPLTRQFYSLAEALEVDNLPLTQEADDVIDIRVV